MIFKHNYKLVGLVIASAAIASAIVFKFIYIPSLPFIKKLLVDFFIVGLAVIAFSKETIEDERILAIRTKSLSAAFLFSIIFCLCISALNFILGDFELSGHELTIVALIIYLLFFAYLKRLDGNESID
ncbi:hypothetical protein DYU05_18725 [Mucilaginibacter terrenus]|uniref:Uncharacterized protein n=1 Tax=Mucilaginibacter terrenus TaxID=2482727 RepID=A0A3E2NLI2_9SPHI|nr:hypothetical protein [Mucilaginibacter terrenus]RFZ81855.1 hypothetical protein DYU05_18725 [Mucilaginibacter terrenus]